MLCDANCARPPNPVLPGQQSQLLQYDDTADNDAAEDSADDDAAADAADSDNNDDTTTTTTTTTALTNHDNSHDLVQIVRSGREGKQIVLAYACFEISKICEQFPKHKQTAFIRK